MRINTLLLCSLIGLLWSCTTATQTREKNTSPKKENKDQTAKGLPCKDDDFNLASYLVAYAEDIESQKIMYNSEPMSDCSGMFIRLTQAIAEECPAASYPDPSKTRSSRALARWYYDQGNLTLIQDASKAGHLIKPGAVLFYGKSGRKYSNITIDKIASSDGIEHVGTVTSIEKDANGKVVKYSLYHGRSTGKIASRTNYHDLKPRRKELPPFGNWNQQLVAIGYLVKPN